MRAEVMVPVVSRAPLRVSVLASTWCDALPPWTGIGFIDGVVGVELRPSRSPLPPGGAGRKTPGAPLVAGKLVGVAVLLPGPVTYGMLPDEFQWLCRPNPGYPGIAPGTSELGE